MIDGERRGVLAAGEDLAPVLKEAQVTGFVPRIPTDEELAALAADAWIEFDSRGYAHITPRESFLHGYIQACRGLLSAFTQEEVTHAETDSQSIAG